MKRILLLFVILVILSCSKQHSDPKIYLKEGQDLFHAGKYLEARQSLLKGIELAPSDFDLLYYAGLCYQKEYVFDSALFYFKRADLLYPDSRELNLALFHVAPKIEEWDYAITAIRALVRLGDSQELYWQQLAEYNSNKRAFVHAMFFSRKLLIREPDDPNRYLQMVNAAISAGSLMTANAFIDTAIDKFGELTELKANRGAVLSMSGQLSQAEIIFRQLLIKDPNNPSLLLNLANTLTSYDNDSKKKEGLDIFIKIRSQFDGTLGLDSLITILQDDLGISQ